MSDIDPKETHRFSFSKKGAADAVALRKNMAGGVTLQGRECPIPEEDLKLSPHPETGDLIVTSTEEAFFKNFIDKYKGAIGEEEFEERCASILSPLSESEEIIGDEEETESESDGEEELNALVLAADESAEIRQASEDRIRKLTPAPIKNEPRRKKNDSIVSKPRECVKPSCKAPLPRGARFCPRCGEFQYQFCPHCGEALL